VLARFGIDATAMITGSSGVHVVVAIERTIGFDRTAVVTRALAGLVAMAVPEIATIEFLKKQRCGKVFVDWLRNRPGQTAVAPWSLRPRPEATVAVPVTWDELASIPPTGITIHDVTDRIEAAVPWSPSIDLARRADAIETAARADGVDLDTPFDRFGRTSTG
jgi:bifunctional non-homologous end joining protein LigD